MARQQNDRKLADILSELYPDVGTAQAVARYVGLDTEHVDFTGAAHDVWVRLVQHARQRNQLRLLLAYAREDAPGREDLRQISIAELGKHDRDWAVQDMGAYLLDSLRDEMRSMEQRLTNRIGEVDAKVDSLKSVSLLYTATKRTAWLLGFVLFCLPCLLFIEELRVWLDVSVTSATAVILVTWSLAGILFMYGMGLLRNL